MSIRFQVTIDCADPERQSTFWAEALHYAIPDAPAPHASWEEWAKAEGIPEEQWNDTRAVEDPDGVGPRLFFQKVPEGKTAKNRMHLDLNASPGPGTPFDEKKRLVDAQVERLKALGASDGRGAISEHGSYWVRMNDPEGNEFCVQ